MAQCPVLPNPAGFDTINQVKFLDSLVQEGDYALAGGGTRNFGTGKIRLDIPAGATIESATIIWNTYVSNDDITSEDIKVNGEEFSGTPRGLASSTCWVNPPNDITNYLRNRVYSVNASGTITKPGTYTVTDMPVDLTKPIGTDGDRVPGCRSSQGAAIQAFYKWNEDKGPKDEKERMRLIITFIGAKAVIPTKFRGFFGSSPSQTLTYDATKDGDIYTAQPKVSLAGGDTQRILSGDRAIWNGRRLQPTANYFLKVNGPSFSAKTHTVDGARETGNKLFVGTSNDCVNWCLHVYSGAKFTPPPPRLKQVDCYISTPQGSYGTDATEIKVQCDCNMVPDIDRNREFPEPVHYVKATPNLPTQENPDPGGEFEIIKVVKKTPDEDGEDTGSAGKKVNWTIERAQNGTTAIELVDGSTALILMVTTSNYRDFMRDAARKERGGRRPQAGNMEGNVRRVGVI